MIKVVLNLWNYYMIKIFIYKNFVVQDYAIKVLKLPHTANEVISYLFLDIY